MHTPFWKYNTLVNFGHKISITVKCNCISHAKEIIISADITENTDMPRLCLRGTRQRKSADGSWLRWTHRTCWVRECIFNEYHSTYIRKTIRQDKIQVCNWSFTTAVDSVPFRVWCLFIELHKMCQIRYSYRVLQFRLHFNVFLLGTWWNLSIFNVWKRRQWKKSRV